MTEVQSGEMPVKPSGSRAFYSATVAEFLVTDTNAIVGQLSSRQVAFHQSAEAEQIRAWEREVEILREVFKSGEETFASWRLLIEMPLLRLGKRLDAVLVSGDVVAVIEFKIGSNSYDSSSRLQTERYAQCLRDFHEASQQRFIVPILCAEKAEPKPIKVTSFDGVTELLLTNATTLSDALRQVATYSLSDVGKQELHDFDRSPYTPTPTIVEAAQELYAGHQIADIGRGDAADAELQATAELLQQIVKTAELEGSRTICFVTGAPGAGKTLLGLDLALKSRSGTRPAALLSGNRPLVHVLTEALAADNAKRTGATKSSAKTQADAAIQNLLGYLREHTDGAAPPEHVIVFDEAQRAWDEEVGQELMGRPTSEPALFLEILSRLDWSCLVCLVGPGQEINRGEGGLPLWGQALARASIAERPWKVIAAPEALDGGPNVAGAGLLSGVEDIELQIQREARLHLSNSIRAYRNPLHGEWVAALLNSNIAKAYALSTKMDAPPAYLTRDLEVAKAWLRDRRRGGRSVGILASSGAVRLVGDGIPPTPRSNELGLIGHWFLKPYTDFRSAGALETPMSEFGCQGLELDYTAVCWGGDLVWQGDKWLPKRMSAPKWQVIHDADKQRFRLNGYRVLLTRARAGLVIYVPLGCDDDATRAPRELDRISHTLAASGCEMI